MSEKTPCVRCSRGIDAWAKICPFCNWDQSAAPPAQEPPKPAAVLEYRPPEEFDLKKKAMFAGGGVLLLILAFLVGMVINSDGAPKEAPKTVEEQAAEEQQARQVTAVKRADTPLVPVDGPAGIEQPITSAPVAAAPGAAPNDYQRTDATAVSSAEYAEIAKRAKAEKKRMAMAIDPRSLTGPAYAQGQPARPRPATAQQPQSPQQQAAAGQPPMPMPMPPMTSQSNAPAPEPQQPQMQMQPRRRASIRTRPVPQYQPLPHIASQGTARLSLMIGADGRVKSIEIEKALQRNTAQLVSAVQSWRFKPATENGDPIAAPYSVEITFKQ
jgi:periplasmic protein TonB